MSEILHSAIERVQHSKHAFCRFITANDTGETGSHQAGFYVPKCAAPLLFDQPAQRGSNMERFVNIKWQNDFTTHSRFIYYGKGTRNEYRITRFAKGFPFLNDDNVGDLLILAHEEDDSYYGFVLSSDEDIEDFFACFNLSSETTNQLIDTKGVLPLEARLKILIEETIAKHPDFPDTQQMANFAQCIRNKAEHLSDADVRRKPDSILLNWIATEYSLFRCFEEKFYRPIYSRPFANCQDLIDFSNVILNRRKSRAGKSLEHHLSTIFTISELKFEEQAVTEDNKKPDFLFPGGIEYHNLLFPTDKLVFLGAKTTCKDRWRQVLNEADRIDHKYLFTLQQGISKNQLKEMQHEHLTLVVPEAYRNSFDAEYRDNIQSLSTFIAMVAEKQR